MWDKIQAILMSIIIGIVIGYYWAYKVYCVEEVISFKDFFLISLK
jgi:uncharacterized protein YneF (UPF0154 family)